MSEVDVKETVDNEEVEKAPAEELVDMILAGELHAANQKCNSIVEAKVIEKIEEEKHDSRLQSLEMKMGTLHEKVYNGRSRSHDSILKIQGLIANHDYRLSNIEASVSIKVNSGNRYNPHDN